jgi:hypothetical protein
VFKSAYTVLVELKVGELLTVREARRAKSDTHIHMSPIQGDAIFGWDNNSAWEEYNT